MKFDSSYLWSPKYAKWIILSLFSLFTLLIIFELVSLFTFHRRINATTTPLQTPALPSVKQGIKIENFDTELFGTYVPPNLSPANIKESKLNLEVVSIIFSNDSDTSVVLIRADDGEEIPYKVGDTLPGGVIIRRIMADGVLVEHKDALESLRLPEDSLQFEAPTKTLDLDED